MADEEKKTAAPTPEKPAEGPAPEKKAKRRMNPASLTNLKKGPPRGAGEKRAPDVTSTATTQPPPQGGSWSFFEGW